MNIVGDCEQEGVSELFAQTREITELDLGILLAYNESLCSSVR